MNFLELLILQFAIGHFVSLIYLAISGGDDNPYMFLVSIGRNNIFRLFLKILLTIFPVLFICICMIYGVFLIIVYTIKQYFNWLTSDFKKK